MIKTLKWIGISLVCLVVLLVAGAFAAIQLLDAEYYKNVLQKTVEAQTGRTLEIKGDVEANLGFTPAFTIYDASLTNPDWASSDHLITAQSVRVGLQLLPLIRKNVVIDYVDLEGATLALETSKSGKKSWEFEKPEDGAEAKTEDKNGAEKEAVVVENDAGEEVKASTISDTVRSILVKNSTIVYHPYGDQKRSFAVSEFSVGSITETSIENIAFNFVLNEVARTSGTASYEDETLQIDARTAGNGASYITLQGTVADIPDSGDADLQLNAELVDGSLLRAFTADAPSLDKPVSLSAHVGGSLEAIQLTNLKLAYDNQALTGNASLRLNKKVPYLQADLKGGTIKLAVGGNAAPAPQESTAPAKPDDETRVIPNAPLPKAWMKALNADITLAVAKLVLPKTSLENIEAQATLRDGTLRVDPFGMNTSKGWVNGNVVMDANANSMAILLDAKDVNINDLLQQTTGESRMQKGTAKLHIDATGYGDNLYRWLDSAEGEVALVLNNAEFDVPSGLTAGINFVDALRGNTGNEDVGVSCFVSTFQLENGIAKSKAIVFDTPGARVSGNGVLNLSQETMNITLKARSDFIGTADFVPPLLLRGRWVNPQVILDPAGTLLGIGKVILGTASGVGLVAVVGDKTLTKLGVTDSDISCLEGVASGTDTGTEIEEKPAPSTPQEAVKQDMKNAENAIRKERDAAKEELKKIEDDVRAIRDNVKDIFKKK